MEKICPDSAWVPVRAGHPTKLNNHIKRSVVRDPKTALKKLQSYLDFAGSKVVGAALK